MPVIKFKNYLAASRKANLIRFGMYRAEDVSSVDVIDSAADSPVGFTGAQDGSNQSFTISAPITALYRNGLRQRTPEDYLVTGNTLTWVVSPAADDIILGYTI